MKKALSVIITVTLLIAAACQGSLLTVLAAEGAEESPRPSVVTTRKDSEEPEKPEASVPDTSGGEYVGTAQEEPADVNPLTGEAGFNTNVLGKRPVAVMINNHPSNFPQYNVSKADILFEVVVEHGYSRFMGIFADYTDVPYLVSVRSYRYYFPALSSGFDAFYIHWGEDQTMLWYLDELGVDSYDGLSNGYLFGRDQDRLNNGYAAEHASCLYGNLLPDQIASDAKRTDLKEEMKGDAFCFVPFGQIRIPDGEDCNFAYITFDEETAQFTYDDDTGKYWKYAYEEPQMDGMTQQQLSFTNVIVLYTKIATREDEPEADRKFIEVLGSREDDYTVGYYLSQGKIQPIKWEKTDEYHRLRFFDRNGEELQMNRGKTYIAITYTDSADFSAEIPDAYH